MLGQVELDDLLSQRERLNQELQQILDQHTDPWGIKVTAVEVKHVELPADMQRAMARQAEAEREKRAKIIHAAGEFEASEKLAQAAAVIATEPSAITLRYLQTLTEIAAEQNSTIIFPLPIELLNMMKIVPTSMRDRHHEDTKITKVTKISLGTLLCPSCARSSAS